MIEEAAKCVAKYLDIETVKVIVKAIDDAPTCVEIVTDLVIEEALRVRGDRD